MKKLSEHKGAFNECSERWLSQLESEFDIDCNPAFVLKHLMADGPGTRGGRSFSTRALQLAGVEIPADVSGYYPDNEFTLHVMALYQRYLMSDTLVSRLHSQNPAELFEALREAMSIADGIADNCRKLEDSHFADSSHQQRASELRRALASHVHAVILPPAQGLVETVGGAGLETEGLPDIAMVRYIYDTLTKLAATPDPTIRRG